MKRRRLSASMCNQTSSMTKANRAHPLLWRRTKPPVARTLTSITGQTRETMEWCSLTNSRRSRSLRSLPSAIERTQTHRRRKFSLSPREDQIRSSWRLKSNNKSHRRTSLLTRDRALRRVERANGPWTAVKSILTTRLIVWSLDTQMVMGGSAIDSCARKSKKNSAWWVSRCCTRSTWLTRNLMTLTTKINAFPTIFTHTPTHRQMCARQTPQFLILETTMISLRELWTTRIYLNLRLL